MCRPSADLYCTLEVDSFGYFVNKAKTRVYRDTTEPNWNEVSYYFQILLELWPWQAGQDLVPVDSLNHPPPPPGAP